MSKSHILVSKKPHLRIIYFSKYEKYEHHNLVIHVAFVLLRKINPLWKRRKKLT